MFAIALMLAGQQATQQVQPERLVEVVITGNRMREAARGRPDAPRATGRAPPQ